MPNNAQDIYADPLFVGMTRPATKWGVPYAAFVIEFMVTTIIFLAVGNPLYLAIVVPVHSILYLISAHDPNIFNAMWLWLKTYGRSRNTNFWGSASFSPLPVKKWSK
jgi:type IV secretion system protein VirB3